MWLGLSQSASLEPAEMPRRRFYAKGKGGSLTSETKGGYQQSVFDVPCGTKFINLLHKVGNFVIMNLPT